MVLSTIADSFIYFPMPRPLFCKLMRMGFLSQPEREGMNDKH